MSPPPMSKQTTLGVLAAGLILLWVAGQFLVPTLIDAQTSPFGPAGSEPDPDPLAAVLVALYFLAPWTLLAALAPLVVLLATLFASRTPSRLMWAGWSAAGAWLVSMAGVTLARLYRVETTDTGTTTEPIVGGMAPYVVEFLGKGALLTALVLVMLFAIPLLRASARQTVP